MAIINNQGVFISPSLGGGKGDGTKITSFREDDDFSTDLFRESVTLAKLPENVGIALIRSSESPADYVTISLKGADTSAVYLNNTYNDADFVVSGDIFVGYDSIKDFDRFLSVSLSNSPWNIAPNLLKYKFGKNGNLFASGGIRALGPIVGTNLTGATKYFNIEHPTKENHRLIHACLEGPENGVYIRGRLTNSNVIELPDYWNGFVDPESITVSLTQIGYSQDLIVDKIEWGRRVLIKSGNGTSIDCYYTINGTRTDVPPLKVELPIDSPD